MKKFFHEPKAHRTLHIAGIHAGGRNGAASDTPEDKGTPAGPKGIHWKANRLKLYMNKICRSVFIIAGFVIAPNRISSEAFREMNS